MNGETDRGYGARRGWDDDTSMVLSTAVTSPEAEEHGVKNDVTLSGLGLETDRLARTFQADTPLSGARSANIGRSLANSGQTPTRDKTSIVDYSVGWHLETNSFHHHVRLI